jgi:hypothetical protein
MKDKVNSRRDFVKSLAAMGAKAAFPSVMLAGCNPSAILGKQYDVCIYGATPGGVACAVRAAREGLKVLLISFNDRISGMLTSGLGVWDTLYEGYRSPIYNELRQTFFDYYKNKYGEGSQEYKDALPGVSGHNNGTFEAHVAEKLVNELVTKEKNIDVLLDHYPVETAKKGKLISGITLQKMDARSKVVVSANYFADCSYEGDLMATANVSYKVGRESRAEHNEKHAGKIFMKPNGVSEWDEREERIFKKLNTRHFGHFQNIIYPESTHEGDSKVQAYNMRYYATNVPENQVKLTPSDKYDPSYLKTLEFQVPTGVIKPNSKFGVNRPQLVGLHNKYVEGDWKTRREVINEHIRLTRDMIYYVQNDPLAPVSLRQAWQGWGLAKDEYVDNNNNPYEIYVRESRRLVGKHVYSENDLALHADYDRTPLHADSIGIIEWYQDCHACTSFRLPNSLDEGKMMLDMETFVGQLPYRCIVGNEVDNLLVPVCVSTTHVAWGAIRLEPTWMQIGESAAYAILQSIKSKVKLPDIDTEVLTQTLAEKRSMVTFFNDFYINGEQTWIPAVQYFGTKGFFPEYDAKPLNELDRATAGLWVEGVLNIKNKSLNVNELAQKIQSVKLEQGISFEDFNLMLKVKGFPEIQKNGAIVSRAVACEHLFNLV